MKKWPAVLILLLVIVFWCFSGTRRYPWKIGDKSAILSTGSESVRLVLDEGTLSPTGASFRIWNDTQGTFPMGEEYSIEIWHRGSWHVIEPKKALDWPLTRWEMGPGEHTFSVDWSAVYGKLPRGRYRLVKPYFGKPLYLLCEFELP